MEHIFKPPQVTSEQLSTLVLEKGEVVFNNTDGYFYTGDGLTSGGKLIVNTPNQHFYCECYNSDYIGPECVRFDNTNIYIGTATPSTFQNIFQKYDEMYPYSNLVLGSSDNKITSGGCYDIYIRKPKYNFIQGFGHSISGAESHAEGVRTTISGYYNHTEGYNTCVIGEECHAEGRNTLAEGRYSHAEGYNTSAMFGHAEGYNSLAGEGHAEGLYTIAVAGPGGHSEGDNTFVFRRGGHAEGNGTVSLGYWNHAEGLSTIILSPRNYHGGLNSPDNTTLNIHGEYVLISSFINISNRFDYNEIYENLNNKDLTVRGAHVEGYGTVAIADYQHVEGRWNIPLTGYQHIVGGGNLNRINGQLDEQCKPIRLNIQTLDWNGNEWNSGCVSAANFYFNNDTESLSTKLINLQNGLSAISNNSLNCGYTSGFESVRSGNYANTEGYMTYATAEYSHAEGWRTYASGKYSHAEGSSTSTSGIGAHVEGTCCKANGPYSHAEGIGTVAAGEETHTEGVNTSANFRGAHAEGYKNTVYGYYSHVEGAENMIEDIISGAHAEGLENCIWSDTNNGGRYELRMFSH